MLISACEGQAGLTGEDHTAVIAQKKGPFDQVVDLMLNLFSKG
jgi:hypothetical protein